MRTAEDQESRGSHVNGHIARAMQENASSLFEGDLQLVTLDDIAEKSGDGDQALA